MRPDVAPLLLPPLPLRHRRAFRRVIRRIGRGKLLEPLHTRLACCIFVGSLATASSSLNYAKHFAGRPPPPRVVAPTVVE